MPRKVPRKEHTRVRKTGKVESVTKHNMSVGSKGFFQRLKTKKIEYDTKKERQRLEEFREKARMEEERIKQEKPLKEARAKLVHEKEELFEDLMSNEFDSTSKKYQIFEKGGVYEVKKGLFDRHAFTTKEEAEIYRDFRVRNDLRNKAGLGKDKKSFKFVELPEVKSVEEALGKGFKEINEARIRGSKRGNFGE